MKLDERDLLRVSLCLLVSVVMKAPLHHRGPESQRYTEKIFCVPVSFVIIH